MTQRIGWGGSTNFYNALTMVLRKFVIHKVPPLTVKNSSLVVFSDMQMDQAMDHGAYRTVYENLTRMYHDAGLQSIYETPYEVPHIVFWNLRKTNGFPTIGNEKGVTMISGYDSTMIEVLMNQGVSSLRQMTAWDLLQDTLNQPRFNHVN